MAARNPDKTNCQHGLQSGVVGADAGYVSLGVIIAYLRGNNHGGAGYSRVQSPDKSEETFAPIPIKIKTTCFLATRLLTS